jgi:putative membrane protein
MKSNLLVYTLAFGVAVGFAHSAVAEEHHQKKTELTDDVFAKKAAAGGLTEVELGKVAQQSGGSQDVKDFGAKMVTDHGKANDNLKAVATKDNLTIPDKPNDEQQALIEKLSKETGEAFDKDYIHAMVKAHMGDRALFTEEVAGAKNPDLKQFAQDTLPVIKEHLSMIEGMAGMGAGHHAK